MKRTESKNKRKLCTSEQRDSSTEGKDEVSDRSFDVYAYIVRTLVFPYRNTVLRVLVNVNIGPFITEVIIKS